MILDVFSEMLERGSIQVSWDDPGLRYFSSKPQELSDYSMRYRSGEWRVGFPRGIPRGLSRIERAASRIDGLLRILFYCP